MLVVPSRAFGAELSLPKDEVVQTYERDWQTAFKKLALATSAYGICEYVPNTVLVEGARSAGLGLGLDSIVGLLKNILEAYAEQVGIAGVPESKKLSKAKMSDLKEKYVHSNIRAVRLKMSQVTHIFNLFFHFVMWYWMVKSVFADTGYPVEQFAFYMTCIVTSILYNAHELHHLYKTESTRNDRPIARVAQAFSAVPLLHQLQNYFDSLLSIQKIVTEGSKIIIQVGWTKQQLALYLIIEMLIAYEIVVGAGQVVFNTTTYIHDYKNKRALLDKLRLMITRMSEQKKEEPKCAGQNRLRYNVAEKDVQGAPVGQNNEAQSLLEEKSEITLELTVSTDPGPPELPIAKKTKEKTRKPGDPGRSKKSKNEKSDPVLNIGETDHDLLRRQALERLDKLSSRQTLSEEEINEEINALLRFLPTARLQEGGHNKGSLILSFPDSKKYRLSFETPHHQRGAESNEYKKSRKERVLDVLRLGYLFGWKEERIREYMAKNDIVSFYNLPAFLVRILWERGVEGNA